MVIRLINITDSKSSHALYNVPQPSNQPRRKKGNRKTEEFCIIYDSTERAKASAISILQYRHQFAVERASTAKMYVCHS
jgi:hypothetical protein